MQFGKPLSKEDHTCLISLGRCLLFEKICAIRNITQSLPNKFSWRLVLCWWQNIHCVLACRHVMTMPILVDVYSFRQWFTFNLKIPVMFSVLLSCCFLKRICLTIARWHRDSFFKVIYENLNGWMTPQWKQVSQIRKFHAFIFVFHKRVLHG